MFKNKNILIIGDVMLDTYLYGDVNRISPEAPVPIVNIKSREYKLGGAANVAYNIKKLGSNPFLCSVVGNDLDGDKLKEIMLSNDIDTELILTTNERKTTSKTRIIGNNNHIVRYDDEDIEELNYNNFKSIVRKIEIIIDREDIDVILIQDYDKGVIDRNLIDKIMDLSSVENIPVIVDPKIRNFNLYENVKLFKPNLKELKDGLNLHLNLSRDEILELGCKKLHKRGIEIVFVTLSSDGIYVSHNDGHSIVSGDKIHVSDSSGAGDTVISVIATLIKEDITVERVAEISNIAGGLVCEHIGVVPIDRDKLIKEL